jgi:hypothetical protein
MVREYANAAPNGVRDAPRRGTLRAMRRVALVVALAAVACGSSAPGSSAPAGIDSGLADSGSSNGGGHDATAGTEGGEAADAGKSGGDSGTSTGVDGGAAACKRGIATNTPPSSALAPSATVPGVSWWYDWSNKGSGAASGVAFVPMIWGGANLTASVPAGSSYLLGFNEPNFKAQSNLTPQQAATDWPQVEALAKPLGIQLVSPAVNFCGSSTNTSGCSDPAVTDPYTWLKDFFAACVGCQVDAVAVHWYNCDLPSLRGYIDGSASLQGFVQFGKPIWLTEFSCDGSHTVAQQQAYMQAAVPYLEGNAHVQRYSWFSSSNIASAQLMDTTGTPTPLGTTYAGLPESCK